MLKKIFPFVTKQKQKWNKIIILNMVLLKVSTKTNKQNGFKIRPSIIEYDWTLVRLYKRTSDQVSDVPRLIFFPQFLAEFFAKIIPIYFYFFQFYKNKNKEFECSKSMRNYEKNNACNIRRLVAGSFVQTNQHPSELNYRLTVFQTHCDKK